MVHPCTGEVNGLGPSERRRLMGHAFVGEIEYEILSDEGQADGAAVDASGRGGAAGVGAGGEDGPGGGGRAGGGGEGRGMVAQMQRVESKVAHAMKEKRSRGARAAGGAGARAGGADAAAGGEDPAVRARLDRRSRDEGREMGEGGGESGRLSGERKVQPREKDNRRASTERAGSKRKAGTGAGEGKGDGSGQRRTENLDL